MGKYASKVVAQAQAWIGKKESDGSHREIIDIYNSHKPLARGYKVKYTDAWCSTFVSAVAVKLGYTDIIPTECGCEKHVQLFKNIGSWIEDENRTPNPGDIIFYDWDDNGVGDNVGNSDHVGIVEKVFGSTITVIEGNINDAVGRRTIQINGKYIRGYGVPKYDVEEQPVVAPTPAPITSVTGKVATIQRTLNSRYGLNIAVDNVAGSQTKKALVIGLQKELNTQFGARLVVDGVFGTKTNNACETLRKGSRGNITWIMQARLRCLGYNTNGVDGVFGNGTLSAVKQFQTNKKIAVDGVVGKITWRKLFN